MTSILCVLVYFAAWAMVVDGLHYLFPEVPIQRLAYAAFTFAAATGGFMLAWQLGS